MYIYVPYHYVHKLITHIIFISISMMFCCLQTPPSAKTRGSIVGDRGKLPFSIRHDHVHIHLAHHGFQKHGLGKTDGDDRSMEDRDI